MGARRRGGGAVNEPIPYVLADDELPVPYVPVGYDYPIGYRIVEAAE